MVVEHVLAIGNEVGETPIWIPEEQALYWIDIEGKRVFRLAPATGAVQSWDPGVPVTALARRAGGGWVLATKVGIYLWSPASGPATFLVNPVADRPGIRFNDAAVDRQGRLLAGSMNERDLYAPDGALFRIDPDGAVTRLDEGYAVANGIGLSPDGHTLYVTDMFHGRILAYDYDPGPGTASGRRTFATVPAADGLPDGLIVDSEGCVWGAHWAGARVTRYDPAGSIERVIRLPVPMVTCMGFGGPDLTDLYVTTAWFTLDAAARQANPQSGDLFRVRTGIRGLPEPEFGALPR